MKTNLRNISKDCVLKDGQERKAPYENKMGGRNYRRIVTLLITAWIILGGLTGILISSSNSVVQAATIYTSGTNPVTNEIISGNYTFEVNDAGDSTSCEMRIDGLLIATMDDTSGSNPDWNYSFETSGFSDGWHTIRFDSIGGATGTDITSISVKFDNNGPVITNATTMYPQGQTTAKPGDMVTIQAKVVEPISSIASVTCDTTGIGGNSAETMYDDGLHNDGSPNDNVYGTAPVIVNTTGGYWATYVHATDTQSNLNNATAGTNVDIYEPTILEIRTDLPAGQSAVKNGDQIRVTAKAVDYKIVISDKVQRKPLDVVLVLDNSGSMSGQKWTDLKSASSTFINSLAENDRCAIVSFNAQGDYEAAKQYSTFLTMSETYNDPQGASYTSNGRNVSKFIINADDGLHLTRWTGSGYAPGCYTPIWDATGMAIQYAINNRRTDAVPVVIAMTDGDDWGSGGREYGSETYCPGASNGASGQTWVVSGGCLWNSPDRAYPSIQREFDTNQFNSLTTISFGSFRPESTRTGLINASVPVFTIGLGITPQGSNASAAQYLTPTANSYKYTTEFDLLSIANSSVNGRYYFAPSSNQLTAIYNNVSEVIQQYGVSTLGLEQPHGIATVQADFSALGITLKVNMFDDGMHGDAKAGDDIYGSDLISVNSLDSGDIVFQVEGTDMAGNVNSTQYTVNLDNTQPVVSSVNTTYPANRTKAQDGYSIYVYSNCSDGQTGLGNVYLDASNIGGADQVPMVDDGTGNDYRAFDGIYTSTNVTIATGLQSGVFTYSVNAYDKAGNLGSQSGNIEIYNDVDINMANLLLHDVISGNFQIIANITDLDGVPDTTTNPRYRIDSNPWHTMWQLSGTNFDATLNTTQYLDGSHTLYVNARDNFGAESTLELEIIFDNTPPSEVTVITPIINEYIEGVYSFKCTAVDAIGIQNVTLTISNETDYEHIKNATMGYNSGTGYYQYVLGTTSLEDGTYNVTVTANDQAGHSKTSSVISINIDNNDPTIILNHPKNADFVSGLVMMNLTVSDAFLEVVEYNIDGSGWVNESVLWNTTKLADGSHDVQIRAKDKAGHELIIMIVVTVDNHYPTCSLSQPAEFRFINGIYTLRAHVADEVGVDSVKIIVNHVIDINATNSSITQVLNTSMGYNAVTNYYEYIFDTTYLPDGNYTANITAKDTAQNITATGNITFYIDNNVPGLTIIDPYNGKLISGLFEIKTIINETFLDWIRYNIDSSGWVDAATLWDTVAVTDGTHSMKIRVQDKAGQYVEETLSVRVDNNNPICSIITPIQNQYINEQFTFKISASDLVELDKVTITVFGKTVNTTYNTDTSSYNLEIDTTVYGDGSQFVSATAYDTSGKTLTSMPVAFHVDNNAPVLTLNSPIDGQYLKGDVSFDVTVLELFTSATEYNVDNKGWSDITELWNTSTVNDGEHTIQIRTRDFIGHETLQTINVIVDNNDPICIIQVPIQNQYIEDTFKFQILAYDEVGVDKVDLNVFYKTIKAVYNEQTGYYEYSINTRFLEDGKYNITAFCVDKTNRSVYSEEIDFRIDNTDPDLRVNSPSNGIYVTGDVEIDLTINDAFPCVTEYNIDGNGWIPYQINPIWNSTAVTDGVHDLEFRSTDPSGHRAEYKITLYVDNFAPTCALHSPAEDQFIEGTFFFKVLAQDEGGIEYVLLKMFNTTVNATYNSQSNYYEYSVALSSKEDGAYNATVIAYDKSGKSTTIGPARFNVDNSAPVLSINFPTSNEFVSDSIKFDLNIDDAFPKSTSYNVDGAGWVATSEFWETQKGRDGEHTVNIRAIDQAGHITEQLITVNVDNTPPKISLVLPKENDFIGGIYTVKVYAADTFGIESVLLTIDGGHEVEISQNPSTGLFELPIDTTKLQLEDGEHVLKVVARDKVFHPSNVTIKIYIDNSPPEINIISPSQGSGEVNFYVNATDLSGIAQISINIDGTGWHDLSSYVGVNDTYRYIWRTGKGDNGHHVFDIKVRDKLGNEETVSGAIDVENKEKDNFLGFLLDILPLIAFIVLILIILIIFMLFRRGSFRKWMGHTEGTGAETKGRDKDVEEILDEEEDYDDLEFEFAKAGVTGEDYSQSAEAKPSVRARPIKRTRAMGKPKGRGGVSVSDLKKQTKDDAGDEVDSENIDWGDDENSSSFMVESYRKSQAKRAPVRKSRKPLKIKSTKKSQRPRPRPRQIKSKLNKY